MSSPRDPVSLDDRLDQASELLNADQPRQALELLQPLTHDPVAQSRYGFQSRLGNAYMGVVDELVAANHLGAYGRFLDLLKKPEERQRFIANNGEETLVQLEEGVRNGMAHAILESQIFVRRIFQINSNLASQAFVSQALASGQLTEQEPLVQSFRSVEADSLYGQIAQATAPIRQAIQASGQEPQIFWFQWLQNAQQSLVQLPEFQRARAYVPSAIAYPF